MLESLALGLLDCSGQTLLSASAVPFQCFSISVLFQLMLLTCTWQA